MNNNELNKYKRVLTELLRRLSGDLDRISETVRTDGLAVGEHDHSVSESTEKEILIESAEEGLQAQVREALKRIEDGSYGRCQDCQGPIAKARLNAIPYTAYCIDCERQREQSQAG